MKVIEKNRDIRSRGNPDGALVVPAPRSTIRVGRGTQTGLAATLVAMVVVGRGASAAGSFTRPTGWVLSCTDMMQEGTKGHRHRDLYSSLRVKNSPGTDIAKSQGGDQHGELPIPHRVAVFRRWHPSQYAQVNALQHIVGELLVAALALTAVVAYCHWHDSQKKPWWRR